MKFGQPLLTTELSGSIGGATASSARGGIGYFRVRARPANPRSFLQSTVRATQTLLANLWRSTMTNVQRAAWTALARDQESGINAFVRATFQYAQAGDTPNLDANTQISLADEIIMASVIADASAHTITFNTTVDPKNNAAVYVTPPQSPSRGARQFPYHLAGYVGVNGDHITLAATDPAYGMTAGKVVYVKIVQYGDLGDSNFNEVATPQEFRATVVA